jgi:hypothetical protein
MFFAIAGALAVGTSVGCAGNSSGNPGTAGTSGNAGSGGSGSAGTTGNGGSGSAGTTGAAGNGAAGSGVAGAGAAGTTGTAGSGAAGTTGAAGSGSGGSGAAGTTGAAGSGTGGSGTGGSGSSTCPSNATFCSGFETTSLPAGAVYNANAAPGDWSRDFAVDTTHHHSGNSSLRVKDGESGATGAYQMLAVPATPTAFWTRFWIMSSIDIGGTEHNAFAGASTGAGTNDTMIEFAEDDYLAFNTKDQDCFPVVGCTGQHPTTPYTIPGNVWQCIEISYDISAQVQQLYVNGSLVINAPNYPGATVATSTPYFKFGYDAYHNTIRQLWYDDVVVAPTRIGCN